MRSVRTSPRPAGRWRARCRHRGRRPAPSADGLRRVPGRPGGRWRWSTRRLHRAQAPCPAPSPPPSCGGVLSCARAVGAAGPARRGRPAARRRVEHGVALPARPGRRPVRVQPGRTSVTAERHDERRRRRPSPPTATRFDCFYVYPTVSTEPGNNANLTVQPAEIGAAAAQASQFSQVCNVWAPMYRQATTVGAEQRRRVHAPASSPPPTPACSSAWKDYLAHDNHGRPIVFIGHSQGAAMLIRLLRAQVDPSPSLRKRMVSAIILGGNVQVPVGRDVGGSFRHIPTCRSAIADGLRHRLFELRLAAAGRRLLRPPGPGRQPAVGADDQGRAAGGLRQPGDVLVAAGRPAALLPAARPPGCRDVTVTTPWVTFPGLYTAQCEQSGGASWLQVTATPAPGDPRPTVSATLGPALGLPPGRREPGPGQPGGRRGQRGGRLPLSRRVGGEFRPEKCVRSGPRLRRWSRSSPSPTRRAAWPRRPPCSRSAWPWRSRGTACSWWTSTRRPASPSPSASIRTSSTRRCTTCWSAGPGWPTSCKAVPGVAGPRTSCRRRSTWPAPRCTC